MHRRGSGGREREGAGAIARLGNLEGRYPPAMQIFISPRRPVHDTKIIGKPHPVILLGNLL